MNIWVRAIDSTDRQLLFIRPSLPTEGPSLDLPREWWEVLADRNDNGTRRHFSLIRRRQLFLQWDDQWINDDQTWMGYKGGFQFLFQWDSMDLSCNSIDQFKKAGLKWNCQCSSVVRCCLFLFNM